MSLVGRMREVFFINVIVSVPLGVAGVVGLAQLAAYVGGRGFEVYLETEICLSLIVILMVLATVLNLRTANKFARTVNTPAALRAFYVLALYPVVFLSILAANAGSLFLNAYLFGFPLFLMGAVLLPYESYVLFREAGGFIRRAKVGVRCYSCGHLFIMDREAKGDGCPMCFVANRNPLAAGVVEKLASPEGGTVAFAPPPDEWRTIPRAVLDPDWYYDYPTDGPIIMSLLGQSGRLSYIVGCTLLVVPSVVAIAFGSIVLFDGLRWEDLVIFSFGVLMAAAGTISLVGLVKGPKGVWLWVMLLSCIFLSLMGYWMIEAVDPSIGVLVIMLAVLSAIFLIIGFAISSKERERRTVSYVGPGLPERPREPI